ncbi:hypothetical protein [Achromobacter aegrifaciens]
MSRALIRSLKKTQRVGAHVQASAAQVQDARAAALSLLHRSVRFKHDRLAVLRLANAVQLGANVDETLWDYCHAVASHMADPTQLQKVQTLRRGMTDQPTGDITPAEPNPRRQE